MNYPILQPILALILWTFVLWFWLYSTRLPAMRRAGIDACTIKNREDLDVLPQSARQVAHNYNHLHEQPTIFYALLFYTHLMGYGDSVNTGLAWTYVGTRAVHSVIQCTSNYVPLRFIVFALGSFCLMAIGIRDVLMAWF